MGKKTKSQPCILQVIFYKTLQGAEPVREWLKGLPAEAKKHIGKELEKIQLGWPVGPPLCKKLLGELWELVTSWDKVEYRVIFSFFGKCTIVLLHAFIKKTKKTPQKDIELANQRLAILKSG